MPDPRRIGHLGKCRTESDVVYGDDGRPGGRQKISVEFKSMSRSASAGSAALLTMMVGGCQDVLGNHRRRETRSEPQSQVWLGLVHAYRKEAQFLGGRHTGHRMLT